MDILLSQDFFPKFGGAHLWLYEVYKRWPEEVTLITQDYTYDLDIRDKQKKFDLKRHGTLNILRKDISVDDINLLNFACLKKFFYLLETIRNIDKTDIVKIHCLRAFPEGIATILLKFFFKHKYKSIVYAHGEELLVAQTSRQISMLAKWVYKNADLIIANSKSTQKLLQKFCSNVNTVVIHPGVDSEAFKISDEKKKSYRQQWRYPDEVIVLTSIARMEPRKNHQMVIRAVADLRKKGYPLVYVIGSDGEEKNSLIYLSKTLGIEKWVRFAGYLTDEEKFLTFSSSDIHIMPSVQVGSMIEGFGIVFLEAAAAGIPSIGGNTGGQGEAVLHGKTGLLVNGESLDEVKDSIEYLIKHEDIRYQLGKEGEKWAKENDWNKVAQKTYKAVQKICKDNKQVKLSF